MPMGAEYAMGQAVEDRETGQEGVVVNIRSHGPDPMWWGYDVQVPHVGCVTVRMIGYRMKAGPPRPKDDILSRYGARR